MKKSKNKLESGFALVEAMAAMAICSIVILALASSLQYSLYLNANSQSTLVAMNDARKIMEQVRIQADTALTGTGSLTDTNYWTNVGGTGWLQTNTFSLTGATRTVTFPSGTAVDPLPVQVTIAWTDKGRAQTFRLVTSVTNR